MKHKDVHNDWILQESYDLYGSHVTVPLRRADAPNYNENIKNEETHKTLREKNLKKAGAHKHVPHKDKPPQVVAKRNARERRRVQAVNSAFVRLRKALPIENTRGKRVSKVKTLQNAIQYIQNLQQLMENGDYYPINNNCSLNPLSDREDIFEEFYFES
ncbi:hypothetical protein FQA39_LY12130 [Lamprigera yunnana]|nr:hypothetical protein FQA39_LY12130 [Lamprigera yunnana]